MSLPRGRSQRIRQHWRLSRDIYNAEDIDKAQVAVKAFEIDFGAKYPKAVAKIIHDLDVLLEFYRYPETHVASPTRAFTAVRRLAQVSMKHRELCGCGRRVRAGHGHLRCRN